MPSACDATEGHMGTFSWCWGSIYSFLYAMWSECLTDNLTEEDEELRLHGLCWCSSPPMWFLHPPSSRPCRFHTPWQKKTKKPQLFLILMQAFLQVSVVLTVLCAPSSTLSILTYLPVCICSFSSAAVCFCNVLSSYLSLHIICLLLCLFSRCLSIVLTFPPCTEWLWQCYASSFLHLCHYFRTVRRLKTCRNSLFKHVKAKESRLSDFLLKKHLITRFCFRFSFESEKFGKNGWVVLICVPWYVWLRSHVWHKHLVNQYR